MRVGCLHAGFHNNGRRRACERVSNDDRRENRKPTNETQSQHGKSIEAKPFEVNPSKSEAGNSIDTWESVFRQCREIRDDRRAQVR